MEGFHLFQEKIKGEVSKIKSNDPQLLFMQSESLSGWDISELEVFGSRHLELFEYEENEEDIEGISFVNFSIEYSAVNQDVQLRIDDFRAVISNFNNDLEFEGKQTVLLLYN